MTSAAWTAQPDSTGAVLELFRAQAELYGRLEACAERQRPLIVEDDATRLMAVIADRRRLTEQLTAIGQRLAPVRAAWTEWCARFSPAERVEADRLVAEAERTLRGLMEADDHDCRLLAAKKETAARALRATQSGSQAMSAYRAPAPSSASRFDSGGEGA